VTAHPSPVGDWASKPIETGPDGSSMVKKRIIRHVVPSTDAWYAKAWSIRETRSHTESPSTTNTLASSATLVHARGCGQGCDAGELGERGLRVDAFGVVSGDDQDLCGAVEDDPECLPQGRCRLVDERGDDLVVLGDLSVQDQPPARQTRSAPGCAPHRSGGDRHFDLLNGVGEDTGTRYRVRARDHLDPRVGLLSESNEAAGEAHRRPAQPTTARLSGSR